jgi:hypothetical protein
LFQKRARNNREGQHARADKGKIRNPSTREATSEPTPHPNAKIIKNGSIKGAANSIFHKRK